jgi:hypothetical protein
MSTVYSLIIYPPITKKSSLSKLIRDFFIGNKWAKICILEDNNITPFLA